MRIVSKLTRSLTRSVRSFARREEGQLIPTLMTAAVLGYSLFAGMVLDMGNLWLHKHNAEIAATAACEAGAMDVYWVAQSDENYLVYKNDFANPAPDTPPPALASFEAAPTGFPISNDSSNPNAPVRGVTITGSCDAGNDSTVAMCAYAKANGYPVGVNGTTVTWSLSGSRPPSPVINPTGRLGVDSFTMPQNVPIAPDMPYGVLPYLSVRVTEKVPTFLLDLFPGVPHEITVAGICHCGLVTKKISVMQFPQVSSQTSSVQIVGACDHMTTVLTMGKRSCFTIGPVGLFGDPDDTITLKGSTLSGGTLDLNCEGDCLSEAPYGMGGGVAMATLGYSCDGGASYTSLADLNMTTPDWTPGPGYITMPGNPPGLRLPANNIHASCPSGQNMILSMAFDNTVDTGCSPVVNPHNPAGLPPPPCPAYQVFFGAQFTGTVTTGPGQGGVGPQVPVNALEFFVADFSTD